MKTKRRGLAERRETLGHSQEKLAEILGVEPSTVGRWERGQTSPQPWSRTRLAHALKISPEELNHLLTEGQTPGTTDQPAQDPACEPVLCALWNHRGTVEGAVALSGGDSRVKRRVFLSLTGPALTAPAHQWLVYEPEPLMSGLRGHRVSAGLVDRLPAMIAELRTMDDVAGGGTVLSLAQHHFDWVTTLLDQASYNERTGRKLLIALAELGQHAGWDAFDAGQLGLAQRYNVAALRAAHSADDRPLGAHILGSMAKQAACQGRPGEAATLAETALAGVRNRATPRLLAELSLRRACALAIRNDASGCTVAISKARAQIEQLESEDDPPWLYWVLPAWITAEAGDVLLRLNQPDRAAALLDEGVDLFDGSFSRDQQLYSIRLADALTRPGRQRDLDAAARRGLAAVGSAASLDSALCVDLLRDLNQQMKPHTKVPAVRDFVERARELVRV